MLIWIYVGVAAACAAFAGASAWGVRKCLVGRKRKRKKKDVEVDKNSIDVVDSKMLEDILGWDAITYEDPRENVPEPYHSTEEHYQTMVHFSRAMEMVHFPNTSYYDFPRRPLGRTSSDPHLNWKLYDRSFVDLALSSALSPMIGKFFKDPDFEGALEQFKEPSKAGVQSSNSSPTYSSATKRNTLFNASGLTDMETDDYYLPVMTDTANRLMGRDDANAVYVHPSLDFRPAYHLSSPRMMPLYRSSFLPAYHASIYSALRRKPRFLKAMGNTGKRRRTSASVIWTAKSQFEEKEADESSTLSGLASSGPTGKAGSGSNDQKSGCDGTPPATTGTPTTLPAKKPAGKRSKTLPVADPPPEDVEEHSATANGFLSHMPSSLTNCWYRSGLRRHRKHFRGLGSRRSMPRS